MRATFHIKITLTDFIILILIFGEEQQLGNSSALVTFFVLGPGFLYHTGFPINSFHALLIPRAYYKPAP
jgi:hypothetical protein